MGRQRRVRDPAMEALHASGVVGSGAVLDLRPAGAGSARHLARRELSGRPQRSIISRLRKLAQPFALEDIMALEQLTAGHGALTAVRTGEGSNIVVLHSLLADRNAFEPVLRRLSAKHRVTLIN